METQEVKNKEGEVMTTKEGVPLKRNVLGEGDTFIPVYNSLIRRENTFKDQKTGEERTIVNYVLKATVRNKDKEIQEVDGKTELYVELTKSQAETFEKKAKQEGFEPNQHLWVCYTYKNEYGNQLGIGLSDNKAPKTFEELEGT